MWINENSFTHGFREALHFQMFLQKEWVPYNSHLSPRENIHSHFKRDNSTPQVFRKAYSHLSLYPVSTLVSSPIRKRTQEDQVTLVSWACINSWEVLSSVTKSFPGNHIYTLNSLPSSDFGLLFSHFEISLPSLFGLLDEIWWDEDIF